MTTQYRKLQPYPLLTLAQEVTAATRAVIDMAYQMRSEGSRKSQVQLCEYHHFVHGARELNSAIRALSEMASPLREELFLAAKEVRRAHRLKRTTAPKCGALRASGGRCSTHLEPGQFRCPLHAQELRKRRKGLVKGMGGPAGGVPHGTF